MAVHGKDNRGAQADSAGKRPKRMTIDLVSLR